MAAKLGIDLIKIEDYKNFKISNACLENFKKVNCSVR